jgi:glycine cleavage system H protein
MDEPNAASAASEARTGNVIDMLIPEDLRYSSDHEWIRLEDGNRVRVGITDYAQDALGDIVYVDLPATGEEVTVGQSISEVESTKSVSDIYAPLAGTVVEVNGDLNDEPEKLNNDPYGDGWIFVIEIADSSALDELLDAAAYGELTEG